MSDSLPAKLITVLLVALALFAGACRQRPDPNDPAVQQSINEARNLGLAFLEENRLDDAEEQFDRLIELDPENAAGHANLGIINLRSGDFTAAEANFQKAISLDTGNVDIKLNLAETYVQMNERQRALGILDAALQQEPDNIPLRYKRAQLTAGDTSLADVHVAALEAVVSLASANIVPRIELTISLIERGAFDQAGFQLAELQTHLPEIPKEAFPHFLDAQEAIQVEDREAALRAARIFHNLIKVTPFYQTGLRLLGIRTDALAGIPVLSEPPIVAQNTGLNGDADILDQLRFTDASENAELPSFVNDANRTLRALALADFNGDTEIDIFLAVWNAEEGIGEYHLLENGFGRFNDVAASAGLQPASTPAAYAAFVDYDNDTLLDLYVVNEGSHQLFRNTGQGSFEDLSAGAGIDRAEGGNKAVFADLDHDGDLDLFVARDEADLVYRNNADGTFTEVGVAMGLAGNPGARTHDVDFGDFDDDGDLDLFVAHSAGVSLYSNRRQGSFEDVAATMGLAGIERAAASAVGDYNNDGFLDLFIAGAPSPGLYINESGSSFTRNVENDGIFSGINSEGLNDAVFFDFDNDGFLDLYFAGVTETLLHNDGSGRFTDETVRLLAQPELEAFQIGFADYNLDRDLDLFLASPSGPVLFRNDGGHLNRSLSLQTRGLLTNNSKNNYFSIGARVEMRAGDLYQMRVVTDPTTYFGLGKRLKADVVRIVFTNGVPQNIFRPGTDQDVIEQQILKGSCPFLYTWNGTEFTFATDILWRSALGMPTGIMGGNTTYAPASPAEDYIKIPEGALEARDGRYQLRITSELWETPFFDEVRLMAVDHPDTLDVLIDERFGPPPAQPVPVYAVDSRLAPAQAVDEGGADVLEKLRADDGIYLAPRSMGPYQGLVAQHEVILTPPSVVRPEGLVLYLKGWIFPTDASINVALAQSSAYAPQPPRVQVQDAEGRWRTVVENMGFPMGKNKMVRVDLRGKFSEDDRRIRVQTNMQIYWDHAFFAGELDAERAAPVIRRTILEPASADLRFRGFSRMYRDSPFGPHLFDYDDTSSEPRWRDLEGRYTRYGNVLPLLEASDDRYVIMNAGDEMAISFDVSSAPELPSGWKRDFILYSNGWLKDGDLNTAHGGTVEPLPFAGMSSYPYGSDEAYPLTEANRAYLDAYNTRVVTRAQFQDVLKNGEN